MASLQLISRMLSLKSLASCKTAVGGLRAQDSHTIELTQKWVAHKLYTAKKTPTPSKRQIDFGIQWSMWNAQITESGGSATGNLRLFLN